MRNLNFSVFLSRVILLGSVLLSLDLHAQVLTNIAGEYAVIGTLSGDQTKSHVAFNANGGWIVYQDNAIDGDGFGIGARRLDGTLSGDLNLFRVNQIGVDDQENPRVTMLRNNGAAFVWQGGKMGFQDVFVRLMNADGTFCTGDIQVNVYTNRDQVEPVVACLDGGNVAVAWSSWGQDGDGYGVFARLLSTNGAPVGSEFQLSQTTAFNQKSPSIAALVDGNFVAAWISQSVQSISESRTFGDGDTNEYSVLVTNVVSSRVYARIFNAAGAPVTGEFIVSGSAALCNDPSVAATSDGGFVVGWSQCSSAAVNSWDVFGRAFSSVGVPVASSFLVNSYTTGDQFAPKVAVSGTNVLFIWTSLGQDTSAEGVYGQYMTFGGVKLGAELQVNTTYVSRQMEPALGVDENGRFLAVWSSYSGGDASFDLYAQRLISNANVPTPAAPYVSALNSSALSITWPDLAGYSVAFYELYVDGSVNPIVVNGHARTVNNLIAGSAHTFQLLYQLSDGRRSSLSPVASGTTWGADLNGDGLPDDWQAAQWGPNPANWPSPSADSDGDGASNLSEFLAGTDPKDPSSVLKTSVTRSGSQMSFFWNTQAGFIYQVQTSTNLSDWQDYGGPRFAHSNTDGVLLGAGGQSSFYRVIRLR